MQTITVFSDFACPYCYLGLGLLQKLKQEGIELQIQWMPYELEPEMPLEGGNLEDYLPRERIERSRAYFNQMGSELNLQYHNMNRKFNTRRAHLTGYYAKDHDRFEEYNQRVFEAYFVHGQNVADPAVLTDIASEIGLDAAEMNRLVDQGAYNERLFRDFGIADSNEVDLIPTFILDEENRFAGAMTYEQFRSNFK